jgi:beta-glucanase (GH16 family)
MDRNRRIGACVAGLLAAAVAFEAAAGEETVTHKDGFGPPKGAEWAAIPELSDEFEGDRLDAAKWHDHNPTWQGRQPAFFAGHNVKVSGGKLHLAMRKEDMKGLPKGYHTFTSAAVQSKALVRYGYFEVRCRPMDSHGSSAFWFYAQTPEVWTEIDMFEMGAGAPKHRHIVHMNAHVFHTLVDPDRHWSSGGKWTAPYRLAEGYHVYALEWAPEYLKYSVDGQCVREMKNTHWHQPLTMNFDSETMPNWFGLPDPNDLPSTFSIEYVRSWRKAEGYGTDRPLSCELTFDAAEARAAKGETKTYRLKTDGAGTLLVVAKHGGSPRPDRVHLEYDEQAFFASQTRQSIRKAVGIEDAGGKRLTLAFSWSKVKGYARNNGYRPDWVDIRPAKAPPSGRAATYELAPADGKAIRMVLQY